MGKHLDIYSAVFNMKPGEMLTYMQRWQARHPGKDEVWETQVDPYLDPPFMLFSAPITNPVLSLLDIICKVNGLDIDWKSSTPVPTDTCLDCMLEVTLTIKGRCLKCAEKVDNYS